MAKRRTLKDAEEELAQAKDRVDVLERKIVTFCLHMEWAKTAWKALPYVAPLFAESRLRIEKDKAHEQDSSGD